MLDNSFRLRYEARKQIRRSDSFSLRKRADAFERLRELGPDGLIALHDAIDQEKKNWQHRQVNLSCMLLMLILPTLFVLQNLWNYDSNSAARTAIGMSVGTLLALLIVSGLLSIRKPATAYQSQMIALAELADMRSINRLIDALDTGDPPVRKRATIAVSALLSSITVENEWAIDLKRRSILYRHLAGDNVPLIVSILNLLTSLRDEQALPMLERLSDSEKPTANDADARSALLVVLPLIRIISARNTGRQTLLRASEYDQAIAETALRPVMDNNAADPEQLLRAPDSDS